MNSEKLSNLKENHDVSMEIREEPQANPENSYSSVSTLLKYTGANSYPKDMLEKIQKISMFIKKIKLVEDPEYYATRSKEYVKVLKATKSKLEKIILKTLFYASLNKDAKNKKGDGEIDINE
jgi:hypothetical protein